MDSENGNIRWHTYIFDTVEVSVQLFDIFLGDSNTVYACGAFNDQEEYDSTRAFVAKIDANTGETIWSKILPNMFFANKGIVNGGLLRIFGSQIGYTGNYYLMDIDSNGVVINKALLPVDYFPVGHDPTQFLFDQNGFLITFETGIYKWGINPDPIWGFEFANGQPNIKGKVWDAHADDLGNIYATGHLFMDTLGNEFFPQTIKLSSTGEVLWVSNEKIEENSIYEGGQKISSSDKFVFIFGSKINFNNSFPDYLFEGFSQNGGIIEFDTIIDGNIFDHCDYAHYGQNHFYLLGRSFVPSSTNPDDYRYKLFSFKIEEPSLATAIRGKMPSPTLFPNPSNGIFTVIQNGGTFYDQLTLYSLQGEMIISQQLLSQNQAFNTPNLSPGIYVVKFSGQNGELYKKLVVASNP
ncbi:MAG: T9SS type A sorting domain-containing protein [Saprospiraceae bacterium]